ncbi:Rv3235 family protein [Streptomyces tubercidicus]|uniref:Rv3235 family protein n=1 Tax=Streptomyces tubercidicus TaxID=47759 RepID=UPI0034668977
MTGTDHTTGSDRSTSHSTSPSAATGHTARPAGAAATDTTRPTAPGSTAADDAPRTPSAATPARLPAVPRPRRAPADRRPLGPAGSGPGPSGRSGSGVRSSTGGRSDSAGRGPGSGGRGPTRTASPRLNRPAAVAAAESRRARTGTPVNPAGAPLPTAGARQRAHENRPHHWFAQQLVLALSGQRPVHALLGHALPAAYDRLAELAPQAPLRPATGPGRRGPAPTVRDCGLCTPRRGVIEAFARVAAGERLRALAFRLELGADSRWRCAALDIGPTPAPWCTAS